jgi:hypothetical protein
MTSVEKSREWADSLLLWLAYASSRFRYYDALCEETQGMTSLAVILKYGKRKCDIKRIRDQELEKYLNDR